MAKAKGKPDAIIRRYEKMAVEEIDAELREAGVDPRPTIDTVNDLVDDKLEELGESPRYRPPKPPN